MATGAFVGLVVGLSASPIAGVVVGGLLPMVAALTAVVGGKGGAAPVDGRPLEPPQLVFPAFLLPLCSAAVPAMLLGILLRSHGALEPADRIGRAFDAWTSIEVEGLEPALARQMAIHEVTGLVPPEWSAAPAESGGAASGAPLPRRAGVLLAAPGQVEDAFDPARYDTPEDCLRAYENYGPPWSNTARWVRDVVEPDRWEEALRRAWQISSSPQD
ncbi:MAG: hypothetical protein AAF682_13235 [Planctomycetota bacterium]